MFLPLSPKVPSALLVKAASIEVLIQPLRLAALSDVQGLAGNDVGTVFEL